MEYKDFAEQYSEDNTISFVLAVLKNGEILEQVTGDDVGVTLSAIDTLNRAVEQDITRQWELLPEGDN